MQVSRARAAVADGIQNLPLKTDDSLTPRDQSHGWSRNSARTGGAATGVTWTDSHERADVTADNVPPFSCVDNFQQKNFCNRSVTSTRLVTDGTPARLRGSRFRRKVAPTVPSAGRPRSPGDFRVKARTLVAEIPVVIFNCSSRDKSVRYRRNLHCASHRAR